MQVLGPTLLFAATSLPLPNICLPPSWNTADFFKDQLVFANYFKMCYIIPCKRCGLFSRIVAIFVLRRI